MKKIKIYQNAHKIVVELLDVCMPRREDVPRNLLVIGAAAAEIQEMVWKELGEEAIAKAFKKEHGLLSAGTRVDGSLGLYAHKRVIELAIRFGMYCPISLKSLADYPDEEIKVATIFDPFAYTDQYTLSEWINDELSAAEEWLNMFCPKGYCFTCHPDWCDWGVYKISEI